MKPLLILFAFSLTALAQSPRIIVGADAPLANDCQALKVGDIYVRSENSANGPINVSRCTQIGALTYAWQPIDHLIVTTLPTACQVGDVAFKSNATAGQNLYGCTAPGVWTLQSSATGSVTSIDASSGVGTVSGSPITATGTIIGVEVVNLQTGTTYTVADSDRGSLVTFTNSSPVAVTLPQAGAGSAFLSGWFAHFENRGAGAVTITPTTSTIDGAATIVLAQHTGLSVFSTGSQYYTLRGDGGVAFTGTGSTVRATSPTLTSPVVGTQTAADNSTKAASTAYVDTAISITGIAIRHVFLAAGSYSYVHGLNSVAPVMSCYLNSGSATYLAAPSDANTVSVTVSSAADLTCAFVRTPAETYQPPQDFAMALSVNNAVATASATIPTTITVTATNDNGHPANVTFSCSACPNGITVTYGTNPVAGTGTSVATIHTPSNLPLVAQTVTISATDGTNTHTIDFTLSVYGYSRLVTLNADTAQVPSNQTNYAVEFIYTFPSARVTNSSGYDIVFGTDQTCSLPLAFNRPGDAWNNSTRLGHFWVQSNLTAGASTPIYVCYGNSSITTDQSTANSTFWDSSYVLLVGGDSTSTDLKGHTLTPTGGTITTTSTSTRAGETAISMAGSGYIATNLIPSTGVGQLLTFSTWFRLADLSAIHSLSGRRAANVGVEMLEVATDGTAAAYYGDGSATQTRTTPTITTAAWHLIQVVIKAGASGYMKLVYDGVVRSTTSVSTGISWTGVDTGWNIAQAFSARYFPGLIDNYRLSNAERSQDWAVIDYNNQKPSQTFYTVGNELVN